MSHQHTNPSELERCGCGIKNRLCAALENLLCAAECADEHGYVTDVGFLDIGAIYEEARAAIAAAREAK